MKSKTSLSRQASSLKRRSFGSSAITGAPSSWPIMRRAVFCQSVR